MKAQPKPSEAMTAQMVLSALIGLPGLIWTGLPAQESWPWIAGSTALNLVTITALLRAYDLIGFGTAYPVVRALSVLLVAPAAIVLSGEQISLYGLLGIGLIVVSLLLLGAGGGAHGAIPRAAFFWVGLAGVTAARAESLWPAQNTGTSAMVADRRAARSGDIITVIVAERTASDLRSRGSGRSRPMPIGARPTRATGDWGGRLISNFLPRRGRIEEGESHRTDASHLAIPHPDPPPSGEGNYGALSL